MKFVDAAKALQAQALDMLCNGKGAEAIPVLEMSFASAFMGGSAPLPVSVRLHPGLERPMGLANDEHVFVHVCKSAIIVTAALNLASSPICELGRFPQLGDLFARVAARLPDQGHYGCIMDLGDGSDVGAYRRIAFSSADPGTLLIPDPFFHMNDGYERLRQRLAQTIRPWSQRRNSLFWRGSAAGPYRKAPEPEGWQGSHRLEVCHRARLSPLAAQLDIGLTSLHQLSETPWLQERASRAGLEADKVEPEAFADYRLLLDMDGWTNSWSLLHKLIMGSTIVKIDSSGGFRQWYYDRLIPWKTHIPIAADLSDFEAVTEWIFAHPAECEAIATAGGALGGSMRLDAEMDLAAQAVMPLLVPLPPH